MTSQVLKLRMICSEHWWTKDIWFLKQKLKSDVDVTDSSPIEKHHAASQCPWGSFGVSIPTIFSVLDGNKNSIIFKNDPHSTKIT